MKHNFKINSILIFFFIISQIIGLAIINNYIDHSSTIQEGKVEYSELPLNIETPEETNNSFIVLIIGILIATALAFALLKFKILGLWKLWFGVAVFMALTIAFNSILIETIAITLAIILTLFKLFKPNFLLHNITEVLIYGGISAIFVPMLTVTSAIILLILISIYDIIAVNHSKHMIHLAKMQTNAKTFAGIQINYFKNKLITKSSGSGKKKEKVQSAILGGGDIVFPLLLTGAVFKSLILTNSIIRSVLLCFIITFFASLSLLYLLIKSEKKKFYPAMPYITTGCLIGYFIIWLIK